MTGNDWRMGDEDRAWLYELVLRKFHDEFCEYDGEEDGQAVCAGECRLMAEQASGATAAQIAAQIAADSQRFNTASMIGQPKKEGADRAAAIARGDR